MKRRRIGRSNLEVAPLAFGGNVFGWTVDEKTAFRLLDAFIEAGFNLIDTADVYSRWISGNKGGESETIIGNWMKSRRNRDQVVISTKVGMEMAEGRKGLSKGYILNEVEESLRRLQTDYIDLYFSHTDDSTFHSRRHWKHIANSFRKEKFVPLGHQTIAVSACSPHCK